MPSLKITKFGGIAPRIQSQNLNESMAQVALDVDLSRTTLRPWRTDNKVSDKTGLSFYADNCCYLTADNCRASFAKIEGDCDFIVATDVLEYPVIRKKDQLCNGEWRRLGFPVDIPELTAQSLGTLDNTFNNETRHYFYTLLSDFDGLGWQESMPSPVSEAVYCNNDFDVVLSGIPTSFPTYTISAVRIYCNVTQLDYGTDKTEAESEFLLVEEIPFGTSVYTHEAHVDYGEACITEEYAPPSDKMHDITYCGNGQLGGLIDCELWLSEPRKPHAWNEAFRYSRFNGKPKRFLCGEKIGYILTDEYPSVISMESPCTSAGCRSIVSLEEPHPIVSLNSACLYNGSCLYATKDGLVMLSGTQSKVITADFYTYDQWQAIKPWTMRGVVHDGYYFGTTEDRTIRFKIPDQIHENATIEALTELSIKPLAWYRSDQDRLFYALNDGIYEWNVGMDWKTFKWQGRLSVLSGYTAMTAYKLVHDYEPTRVVHTGYKRHRSEMVQEPVILGDKIVIDSRPCRLKAGYSTIDFDVMITGKGEVREYHVATSVSELGEK